MSGAMAIVDLSSDYCSWVCWRLGADDVAVTRPNGKSGDPVIDEVFDPAYVVLVYQRAVIFIGQEWRVIFGDDLSIE